MKIFSFSLLAFLLVAFFVTDSRCQCTVGDLDNGSWYRISSYRCCPSSPSECSYGITTVDGLDFLTASETKTVGDYRYSITNYFSWCSASFNRCPFLDGPEAPQVTEWGLNKSRYPKGTQYTYEIVTYIWVCRECNTQIMELISRCGGQNYIANWDSATCSGQCMGSPENNGPEICSGEKK